MKRDDREGGGPARADAWPSVRDPALGDDHLKNTCLLDPVGGSVAFYDTQVRLVKERAEAG